MGKANPVEDLQKRVSTLEASVKSLSEAVKHSGGHEPEHIKAAREAERSAGLKVDYTCKTCKSKATEETTKKGRFLKCSNTECPNSKPTPYPEGSTLPGWVSRKVHQPGAADSGDQK